MGKKRALFSLAALVLVAAQGLGQSGRGMEVAGVPLKLGTPRDKVLLQITRAGYKTLDLPSEGKYSKVAVTNRDLTDKVQASVAAIDNDGVLYFRDGILVRMYHKITDELLLARILPSPSMQLCKSCEAKGSVTGVHLIRQRKPILRLPEWKQEPSF